MRNLWKSVLVLLVIGMWFGVRAPAQAASANGPYYATPSWDQKLDANNRFIVLLNWNSEAVLDRETGLVWERSPHTGQGANGNARVAWHDLSASDLLNARGICTGRNVGGRKGWRLPSLHELMSLLDPSIEPSPFSPPLLPAGHPFTNVLKDTYASATVIADQPTRVFGVSFDTGQFASVDKQAKLLLVWCVRGAGPLDAY